MKSKTIKSGGVLQTQKLAVNLAKTLIVGDILCLYGNLGSGKTTFVQALAKSLGINKRIISPTFIMIRQYKINRYNFYHIDLYRTKTKEDLLSLGMDEILKDKNNIIAIEWAENLLDLLPQKRIDLKFEYIDDNSRRIKMEAYE